jgi:hypothetical protein
LPDILGTQQSSAAIETTCMSTTHEEEAKVADIVDTPYVVLPPDFIAYDDVSRAQYGVTAEDASRSLGLTTHDFTEEVDEKVEGTYPTFHEASFTTEVSTVKRFFAQYGLRLTFPDRRDIPKLQTGVSPIDLDNMSKEEESNVRNSLLQIARGLSYLPVELVQKSGLRTVYLIHEKPLTETSDTILLAHADTGEGHSIYVDPTVEGITGETFDHEFNHIFITNTMCAGDTVAAASDFAINNTFPQITFESDIPEGIANVQFEQNNLDDANNRASNQLNYELSKGKLRHSREDPDGEYLRIQHKELTDVLAPSEYAYANIVEYEAELGVAIETRHESGSAFDKHAPGLRARALRLAARMNRILPGSIEYFHRMSDQYYLPLTQDQNESNTSQK